MKKGLLVRMGLRQRDLSWAARELLETYCRAKSKIVAIDQWLETRPMIDDQGNTVGCMRLYVTALNTSTRTLEALRSLIAEQAREDARFDRALDALAAEGRRVREANSG